MPLDQQVKSMIDQMAALGAPNLWDMQPEQARSMMDMTMAMMGPGEEVESVADRTIDAGDVTLPVRIYRPEGLGEGPHPALVFYHGGGFVIGSLASHDRDCRALANRGRCVVVSVDYRLAPEHPFPAAVDDARAALQWVVDHAAEIGVDPTRLAIGGDSAGGNLSAGLALWARDHDIVLRLQLLIYPAVAGLEDDFASRQQNAAGYMLDREALEWFMAAYFPAGPPSSDDERAAPLHAASHAGLAPALILTAEFDPLRDEGEAYGKALVAAGVPATVTRYDGMIHGFFSMAPMIDAAKPAVDEAGAALAAALHP